MSSRYYQDAPMNPYAVANVGASARAQFIRATYGHLAGAVAVFLGILAFVFTYMIPTREAAIAFFENYFSNRFSMILLVVGFIAIGYLARYWANSQTSRAMQYAGLALYTVAEAVIFIPIMCIAIFFIPSQDGGLGILGQAGILTLSLFGGLTAAVFITQKDFSFLGTILMIGSFIALGVIVAGWIFGFTLGLFFSFFMVALASGFILYTTSNILHHYPTDAYVAASLELFASLALLFYYILMILIQMNGRD
ncbi:MAG: Bax inhibitor-1 family protein [Gemmataceae bacterium]